MKKDWSKIFIFVALAIIIEGIAFLMSGIIWDILWLIVLGGVFCGLYVLLVEFYLLQMIRKKNKEKLTENDLKKTENEMLQEINSTTGFKNYVAVRAHQFANISHSWKVATTWERIWLITLMGLAGCGFVAITILLCLQHIIPSIIVLGVQVLMICGTLIIAKIREKQSFSQLDIDDAASMQVGKVIACSLHSQTTLAKGEMSMAEYKSKYHIEDKMTTRALSIVYKLKIDLDGKKVVAFSKSFYNEGDEVSVCRTKRHKNIYVIVENETKI